jgi:hypothetical protein
VRCVCQCVASMQRSGSALPTLPRAGPVWRRVCAGQINESVSQGEGSGLSLCAGAS